MKIATSDDMQLSEGKTKSNLIQQYAESCISQLKDETKRNRLLYYKELKRGSLNIDINQESNIVILNKLFVGQTIKFRKLIETIYDNEHGDLAGLIDEKLLNIKSIYSKARMYKEEKNIHTLFLHFGLARCEDNHSSYYGANIPILLSKLELKPLNRQSEFELISLDEWFFNDFFVQQLKYYQLGANFLSKFNINDLNYVNARHILNRIANEIALQKIPWSIENNLAIDNFDYAKIALVQDMEDNLDAYQEHPLIKVLAGDTESLDIIKERNLQSDAFLSDRHPDSINPNKEFLILDADSSQIEVINRAMSGASFVVQGPPGTGKSQTIANLIATGMALDKKILFVAEKAVAIEAVAKKLKQAQLDSLFMNVHGKFKKKEIIEKIKKAYHNTHSHQSLDNQQPYDSQLFQDVKDELVQYHRMLHYKFEQYQLSYYEVNCRLLEFNKNQDKLTNLQLTDSVIEKLDIEKYNNLKNSLKKFIDTYYALLQDKKLFDLLDTDELKDEDHVKQVRELYQFMLNNTPFVHFNHLSKTLNLNSLESIKDIISFLKLYFQIIILHKQWGDKIFDQTIDLDKLLIHLQPLTKNFMSRFLSTSFNKNYKASLSEVRNWFKEINQPFEINQIYKQLHQLSKEYKDYQIQLKAYGNHLDMLAIVKNKADLNQDKIIQFEDNLNKLQQIFPKLTLDQRNQFEYIRMLEILSQKVGMLHHLAQYNELKNYLKNHQATSQLLELVDKKALSLDFILPSFEYSFFKSLASYLQLKEPLLAMFNGDLHDNKVIDFQKLDLKHIDNSAYKIRSIASNNFFESKDTNDLIKEQWLTVSKQFDRKRGHLPLKKLFTQTSQALTKLIPCWMMSPLNVAEYLPAKTEFDIVVFDEASQIKPSESNASILRGKDAIIVGDSKQLPPTNFFERSEDEQEADGDNGNIGNYESILDVLGNRLNKSQRLKWHYRSEDERLIAFSNYHFYENTLITFPSVVKESCFEFHLIPWRREVCLDTKLNSNVDEVDKVVDLMLNHARENSDQSLGVIAFGIEHAENIENKLNKELKLINDAQILEFFNDNKPDYTFIRNLERVQGDERDVVILTVGYSKNIRDEVRLQLGPLLKDGGQRRLNVAVTRAKKKVIVTSCFSYKEMPVHKIREDTGTQLLYEYLKYVELGGLNEKAKNKLPLNSFEMDIKDKLERQGLKLIPQHGVAGYYIDFAVVHPNISGQFVLAIEADGAQYHSSQSARDRDRIRQEHLEKLGWKFHRIWSTSWFKDHQKEIKKVLQSYTKAVETF